MVSTLLDYLGGQVEADPSVFVHEHLACHCLTNEHILVLGMALDKTPQDLIQCVWVVHLKGFVEAVRYVFAIQLLPHIVVIGELGWHKRCNKSHDGGGNTVGSSGVGVDVITSEEASVLGTQAVLVHDSFAQDNRQVLRVGDVLHLSPNNPSRLLEQLLVIPMRVDHSKAPENTRCSNHCYFYFYRGPVHLPRYPIMLSHPECVHCHLGAEDMRMMD